MMRHARRFLPLLAIVALLVLALSQGWHRYLSWPVVAEFHGQAAAYVAARPVQAACAYVVIYLASVAASIPGAVVLTVTGGLLFGVWAGTFLAVIGATAGAILFFLAARTALGPLLAGRAKGAVEALRPALERDGFGFLLAARLVPVVPFWLANLAPALAGMRLAPFALATFLGIIPGTAVFASLGAGIGHVLDSGQVPNLAVILSPPVLLPLLALALLAIAPNLWRRWRHRHG
jgi:uncharacterized membrane protein YdjX (TVP38/TMEM64 family)